MNNAKVYDLITEKICGLLEKGVVPWRQTWSGSRNRLGGNMNAISGKAYSGVNCLMTYAVAHVNGYESQNWITFKQALDLGGNVKKGEKATPVIYASKFTPKDAPVTEDGEERSIPFLKYFSVFNVAQCEHLPAQLTATAEVRRYDFSPLEACERIVAGMPNCPRIEVRGGQPCYLPATDVLVIPESSRFEKPVEYYASLFHELTHSTGHASRVGRDIANRYGCEAYAREELVAEIGAAFLSEAGGIESAIIENSAAYVAGWLKALRNDPKMIIGAAAAAQRAADYVLNRSAAAVAAPESEAA